MSENDSFDRDHEHASGIGSQSGRTRTAHGEANKDQAAAA
jgi:hypothetical protein